MIKNIIFILLFCASTLYAQNQLGLHLSGYGGADRVTYNPALFQAGKLNWDVRLVAGGVFVENQYAYIENTSVLDILTTDKALVRRPVADINSSTNPNVKYYNFTDAAQPMNNTGNAFLALPSFNVRINKKWSVGFFSKIRAAFNANDLDPSFDANSLESWGVGEVRNFAATNVSGLLWNEFGLNLGSTIYTRKGKNVSVGINLKYLMGLQAFYVFNPNSSSVLKIPDQLYARSTFVEYGFSSFDEVNMKPLGSGFGVDLGAVYQVWDDNREYIQWQVAVSLIDLGAVQFNKLSEAHRIEAGDPINLQSNAFDQVSGVQDFSRVLSEQAYGDSQASLQENRFTLYTPTAIYVSVDYALNQSLLLNGSINRRVMHHPKQLEKENYFAASLRYESRLWDIGLPVTLFDDRSLRAGLFIRFMFITVGSEHLPSLFIEQKQFSGSDFYFSIRLNALTLKGKTNKKRSPDKCFF